MNRIQFINANLATSTNIVSQTYSSVGNIAITVVVIAIVGIFVWRFFAPTKLPTTKADILTCTCEARNFDHNATSSLMYKCKMTVLYKIKEKEYKTNVHVDSAVNYSATKNIEIIYNPANPYDIKMKILQSASWIKVLSTISIIVSTISLLIWWITHIKDISREVFHSLKKRM